MRYHSAIFCDRAARLKILSWVLIAGVLGGAAVLLLRRKRTRVTHDTAKNAMSTVPGTPYEETTFIAETGSLIPPATQKEPAEIASEIPEMVFADLRVGLTVESVELSDAAAEEVHTRESLPTNVITKMVFLNGSKPNDELKEVPSLHVREEGESLADDPAQASERNLSLPESLLEVRVVVGATEEEVRSDLLSPRDESDVIHGQQDVDSEDLRPKQDLGLDSIIAETPAPPDLQPEATQTEATAGGEETAAIDGFNNANLASATPYKPLVVDPLVNLEIIRQQIESDVLGRTAGVRNESVLTDSQSAPEGIARAEYAEDLSVNADRRVAAIPSDHTRIDVDLSTIKGSSEPATEPFETIVELQQPLSVSPQDIGIADNAPVADAAADIPAQQQHEMVVMQHEDQEKEEEYREEDQVRAEEAEPVVELDAESNSTRSVPKYQPTARTARTTTPQRRPPRRSVSEARTRTLATSIRVVLDRRSRALISGLTQRVSPLANEIMVRGPNGRESWSAIGDDWYAPALPDGIGVLLEAGCRWAMRIGGDSFDWVLSRREIYVLGPIASISGFVSIPRLLLHEDQMVLCAEQQRALVMQALAEAGCANPTIQQGQIPPGWVLFSVRPTSAVLHDDDAGIFNILRPIHEIEIVLRGGIRLDYSRWLVGHSPQIRIRGTETEEVEVLIDGVAARKTVEGCYTAPNYDSLGTHVIFCGGQTKTYEIVEGVQNWKSFEAFSFSPVRSQKGSQRVSICGPLITSAGVNQTLSVVRSDSNCLIGSAPGQIVFLHPQYDSRNSNMVSLTDFTIAWTLPSQPFIADKSTACISSIRLENARLGSDVARSDKYSIRSWCQVILDASRKGLRPMPNTTETLECWASYKRAARSLWKKLQ